MFWQKIKTKGKRDSRKYEHKKNQKRPTIKHHRHHQVDIIYWLKILLHVQLQHRPFQISPNSL